MPPVHCYRFGDFELDLAVFELRQRGRARKLDPRAFTLLQYLVEHHDRVVLKEELLTEVWPDVVVTPAVLPSCIRRIRSALGQSARESQPIQTLHRRGYRLNMRVERVPRGDFLTPPDLHVVRFVG
jgi:DNA-binding winged helix-turn-helix (wHTH) protein